MSNRERKARRRAEQNEWARRSGPVWNWQPDGPLRCPHCGGRPPGVLTFMTVGEVLEHAELAGKPFDVTAAFDASVQMFGLEAVEDQLQWWWCHGCGNGGSMVVS